MKILRACAHQRGVEQRQELGAAVAAADGDDGANRRIAPRIVDDAPRACRGSPATNALPLEDALVVDRLEAEAAQLRDARVEFVALERARGRHERDPVARSQRDAA